MNALLPFESPEEEIRSVEYLNPELVPMNPLRKDSIVDVRCVDGRGRQFLVEMQMMWTPEYKQRVLFNASKAYVSQLDKSRPYELLQPVYSLNLVNDTFSESPDYYHDYRRAFASSSSSFRSSPRGATATVGCKCCGCAT